jgi:galactose-1-phosphate uridylyltransferase
MSELRQDPITHDWVIINPDRAKRPDDKAARQQPVLFARAMNI